MEHLWTPWRYDYVSGEAESPECLFCWAGATAADAGADEDRLVLHRDDRCFVMVNKYPYNNGHLMVAPYAHVGSLEAADPDDLEQLMRLALSCEKILRDTYAPDGFNLGMNVGAAAGAGVADHLHLHVVPRWTGDASFLTTTARTRVVPEDPGDTWARLRPRFATLGDDPSR